MSKKINWNKILIILLVCVGMFVSFLFLISNYDKINDEISRVECSELLESDTVILNTFFQGSEYKGGLEYWCEIATISPRVTFMEDKEIPIEIGKLSNLKLLEIRNGGLVGEIPKEFEKLQQLEFLVLSNNKLEGNIPVGIGRLENIISINVSHNNLSGEIDSRILNLKKLESLNIDNTGLTK